MSESDFVLAIDAGTSRLTAATACVAPSGEIEVASFVVGDGRDAPGVLAAVTADGDLLFSDEADRTAAAHPERVLRDVVTRIGDDVPLIAGGFAIMPEQVLARVVLWLVAAVTARRGSPPAAIALTHPPEWQGHRLEVVGRALRDIDLDVTLLPAPLAAVHEHVGTTADTRHGLRAVFDLGGGSCTVTVVRTGSSGVRQVAPAVATSAVGGDAFDDVLLAHALAMTGIDGAEVVRTADGRAMLRAARISAVEAKQALSFDGDAEMVVRDAAPRATVRITRSEFESMIGDDLESAIDVLEQAIEQADLTPDRLVEVLLVGGSSGIPLVVQRLSGRLDLPLVADADPQLTVARGAARRIWDQRQTDQPPPPTDAETEHAAEEVAARAKAWRGVFGRAAKISAPAASATALTVTAVLVAGGVILGTTAPAGDRSDAAQADAAVSAGSAADTVGGARHDSDFNVADGPDEPRVDAVTDAIIDALDLDAPDVAVSEPRSRVPQAPGDPSTPPSRTPSGGGGDAPAPASGAGGAGGPAPAPSDPAAAPADAPPPDPAPADPAPSDPPPSDPVPSEPTPSDPSATDPDPIEPTPTDPNSPPVDPQPPDPDPSPSAAEDPAPPPTDPSPPPPAP